jgi:site-specific recombinase XerD
MRAKNAQPETIILYRQAVTGLRTFFVERDLPTNGEDIRREHIQAYLTHLLTTPCTKGRPLSPTTVDICFRTLRAFFAWAVKVDYLAASAMRGMDRPTASVRPKEHFWVVPSDVIWGKAHAGAGSIGHGRVQ